jgi:hypothetical protein
MILNKYLSIYGVCSYIFVSVVLQIMYMYVAPAIQFQGVFGQLLAKLTQARTREYLGYEAAGLKRRSEDPGFRR